MTGRPKPRSAPSRTSGHIAKAQKPGKQPAPPAASESRPQANAGGKPARAGIGDIMSGVSLTPSPSVRGTDARHPIGSGIAFERVEDIYRMDPKKVVLEGPYVRQFLEDEDFLRLRASVAISRDIGQHIGVRVVGPPTNQRRVLVYGMRRWKAALAEGLERVPVRDYGAISEEKAVELQMLENEIRADPHPVDTALGFYMLSQQPEWPQKRIAEVFDKNKGYVSEMVRVGEAIARLREVDRQPLYTAPRVTVRAFQSVAQVKSVEARKEAVLALLGPESDAGGAVEGEDAGRDDAGQGRAPGAARGGEQAERRRVVDDAIFHARPLRNGRAFRVRWTDDDLREEPAKIAAEFKARFLEEYTHLLHRASVLTGAAGGTGGVSPANIAALVASAAQDAARVDARIRAMGGAAGGATAADDFACAGDVAGSE